MAEVKSALEQALDKFNASPVFLAGLKECHHLTNAGSLGVIVNDISTCPLCSGTGWISHPIPMHELATQIADAVLAARKEQSNG